MTVRRSVLLALAAMLLMPGLALAFQPYQKPAFDAVVKTGKPVVVHVHANW